MSRRALERAAREADAPFLREHVTTYIRGSRKDLAVGDFRLGHLTQTENLSHLRWTVDYPEDLERVRRYFSTLPEGFGWRDAVAAGEMTEPASEPIT
jgi:spore coat polysaccharide biosynthesis protein SpsF (cytidylyltransferase family)